MVSFESRYGIYGTLFFLSERALMTLPNVKRDLLILAVYFAISPWDLDYLSLSLPAKSTKEIFPYLLTLRPSPLIYPTTYTVMREWLLDESLLSSWLPDFLFLIPSFRTAIKSSMLVQSTMTKSSTKKPFVGFHLQCRTPEFGFSKSLICSLYIYVKDALIENFSAPFWEIFLNCLTYTIDFWWLLEWCRQFNPIWILIDWIFPQHQPLYKSFHFQFVHKQRLLLSIQQVLTPKIHQYWVFGKVLLDESFTQLHS